MYLLINRRARANYGRKYLIKLDMSFSVKVIQQPTQSDLEMLFWWRIPKEFLGVIIPDWLTTLKSIVSDLTTYISIVRFLWSEEDQISLVQVPDVTAETPSLQMTLELKELMIHKICSRHGQRLIQISISPPTSTLTDCPAVCLVDIW